MNIYLQHINSSSVCSVKVQTESFLMPLHNSAGDLHPLSIVTGRDRGSDSVHHKSAGTTGTFRS